MIVGGGLGRHECIHGAVDTGESRFFPYEIDNNIVVM